MKNSCLRAYLHGSGEPQLGEVTCGGSPHLSCKRDQIKMRDYMDRRLPTKAGYLTYLGSPTSMSTGPKMRRREEAGVAEQLTPRTPDLEVRGPSHARRVISLDKEVYTTLSLFTQMQRWVSATYYWRAGGGGGG